MYNSGISTGSVAIFSLLTSHLPLKRRNKLHLFDVFLTARKVLLMSIAAHLSAVSFSLKTSGFGLELIAV